MKILAFAASNSKKSINKKLVTYATTLLKTNSAEILDLNDYEMPIFSEELEAEIGQPDLAHKFLQKITDCDAVIISFAEHNKSYSVAYKNVFDWCSRITQNVYQDKPMILLATSPGSRGADTVLTHAKETMKFFSGVVKGSFSMPNFYDHYDLEQNLIKNKELNQKLKSVLAELYK